MSKDQYEVLEQLGTGSYGSVFKIRRKTDEKVLVWKEINFGTMSEKEKSQLVAEVNILRELRNPFVVRYHDRIVDKPKTRLYIIMEHCSGGDLGRIIKKCKQNRTNLDENLIWKILAQCVVALKDCHRRQENGEMKPILHRDLKPANILLDASQNIKMGDFGLAKELSSQSRLAQTNVGTPFYMAPEIINEKEYDEKSDIWALGCLIYELAALRPPFDGTNVMNLAMKINAGKFMRIPSKYSDNLFDTIRTMLQVDPRRRPRVEELEALPALQPAMTVARATLSDFKQQQQFASKWREMKAKEDSLTEREEAIKKQEVKLQDREERLNQWERELSARQNALNANSALTTASVAPTTTTVTQATSSAEHKDPVLSEEQRRARRISMERCTEQMCMDDAYSAETHPDPVLNTFTSGSSAVVANPAATVSVHDSFAPPRPPAANALQNRFVSRPLPFTVYCDPPASLPSAPRSNTRAAGSALSNHTPNHGTAAPNAPTGVVSSKYAPVLVTGSEYCKENQTTFGDIAPTSAAAVNTLKDRNKDAIYRKIGGPSAGTINRDLPNAANNAVPPRRALADLPVSYTSSESVAGEVDPMETLGSPLKKQRVAQQGYPSTYNTNTAANGAGSVLGVAKPTSFAPAPNKVQVDLQALLRRR